MDRYWLLTSTFYGNWLPGDPRGFVGSVRDTRPGEDESPTRREHDLPGTEYDAALPGLYLASQQLMKGEPIRIDLAEARALLDQFQETARYRGWSLLAVAVMTNHIHLVVGVPGDPDPETLLRDFKSYGSRALTRVAGKPPAGTWWTASGSKRILKDAEAIRDAIGYVLQRQVAPLIVWPPPDAPGEPGALAPGGRARQPTGGLRPRLAPEDHS